VNIFTRRSEWDYDWLKGVPSEVSLCHRYEHARYALLRVANDPQFVFPRNPPFGANEYLWKPIFCLLYWLPEKVKFPQMPYRDARNLLDCQPETLVAKIEDVWAVETEQKLAMPINVTRQEAEEMLAQHRRTLPTTLRPKRGAGGRIRQERTDLKCLGATKLLSLKTAPYAIALTTEALGRPLFKNESEWSRAQKRARTTLEPYCAEAADLYQAL
jgi:hypothetical protein